VNRLDSDQVVQLVKALIDMEKSLKEQVCVPIAFSATSPKSSQTIDPVGYMSDEMKTGKSATVGGERKDSSTDEYVDQSVHLSCCLV
jgi:hypothetical protein